MFLSLMTIRFELPGCGPVVFFVLRGIVCEAIVKSRLE
jgi:hypothetical protein